MKKLLLIAATTILWMGCKKDPVKDLPEASARGANIFACIIDGEIYNIDPNNKRPFGCTPNCSFNSSGLSGVNIYTGNCVETTRFTNFIIYFNKEIVVNKIYNSIDNEIRMYLKAIDYSNSSIYEIVNTEVFKITISHNTDKLIAGTFEGKVVGVAGADSGKVISINNGRFDLKK